LPLFSTLELVGKLNPFACCNNKCRIARAFFHFLISIRFICNFDGCCDVVFCNMAPVCVEILNQALLQKSRLHDSFLKNGGWIVIILSQSIVAQL
jgi:hypothetical protein